MDCQTSITIVSRASLTGVLEERVGTALDPNERCNGKGSIVAHCANVKSERRKHKDLAARNIAIVCIVFPTHQQLHTCTASNAAGDMSDDFRTWRVGGK